MLDDTLTVDMYVNRCSSQAVQLCNPDRIEIPLEGKMTPMTSRVKLINRKLKSRQECQQERILSIQALKYG